MPSETPLVMQVDDEEDILVVTKLALEAIGGLELVQCSSGRQALELAPKHNPDFFLLDVMMPELDGIETLRLLRQIPGFEHKPVVYMTAKATPEDHARLMDCGAKAVITKPFDPMTIASDIVSIWRASLENKVIVPPSGKTGWGQRDSERQLTAGVARYP